MLLLDVLALLPCDAEIEFQSTNLDECKAIRKYQNNDGGWNCNVKQLLHAELNENEIISINYLCVKSKNKMLYESWDGMEFGMISKIIAETGLLRKIDSTEVMISDDW